MPSSKLFVFSIIFSILFPFMLFIIVLHKQYYHQFSSLRIELDQLKSKVSVLESCIERSYHKLQSEDDDISQMETTILEKEENIADLKNKIGSIPVVSFQKGSLDTNKGQINTPHYSPVIELENQIWLKVSQTLRDAETCIEMVITEWIPVLKNQILTFISNLKPHFDFLTAESIEAYHASKNMLLSHFVKLQKSTIPFMQEWIPVLKNQMLNFISNLKPHFDFLTSGTMEAYYWSKTFLISNVVKFQRSATPFMQDLHKYAKPFMNHISTMAKIYLDTALVSLGNLVRKISVLLHDLWKG